VSPSPLPLCVERGLNTPTLTIPYWLVSLGFEICLLESKFITMDSFNLLEISGKSVLYQNLLPLANPEYLDVQIQLYPMFREQGVMSAIPPFTIMYG